MRKLAICSTTLTLLATSASALGEEGAVSISSSGASAATTLPGYMQRYRPEPKLLELGIFLGAFFPSDDHNLHEEIFPQQQFATAPEIGARLGYYPWRALGAEAEGAIMISETDDGQSAGLWAARAHVVGQLPFWSITPFAVFGFGRLGAGSDSIGTDHDPAMHFGVGVKVPVDDVVGFRLDIRDTLSQKNGAAQDTLTHHPEVLLGLALTFDRAKPKPFVPPPELDRDGDGVADAVDKCPQDAGPAPEGCPARDDADSDGILDAADKCPEVAGIAPDGCPDLDSDKDGIPTPSDKCPELPGIEPDGCPDDDPDKDGVAGAADKCPDKPETKNGYQDADGCPDEIPEAVKQFTGVIEGIEFDIGQATIRAGSKPKLDEAVKVMTEFTSVRVLVTGHTDDAGTREKNVELSKARAESVAAYLVEQGIAAGRIESQGMGPDAPIADNKSFAGRQKNRRIEFKLLLN